MWEWNSLPTDIAEFPLEKLLPTLNRRMKDLSRALPRSDGEGGNTAFGFSSLPDLNGINNTAYGYQTLSVNTGGANAAFGFQALRDNKGGYGNCAFGVTALLLNISGDYNSAFGIDALYTNRFGYANSAFGADALGFNIDGRENTAGGFDSLFLNTYGNNNTAWGFKSLYNNLTGSRLIGLGNYAGYWELGDDALYIDNQLRANSAADKSSAIIYGLMAASPSLQRLRLNANVGIMGPATGTSPLNIQGLPTSAAGLAAGDVWNSAGTLKVA